jgi:OOP family OmpA-OmpF porin
MKHFLPFLILFFLFSSQAQNLIPDPGFEIMRRIPSKYENHVNCAKFWGPAGTADYYHRDGDRHAGVPHNAFGRQKPHSGKAYAGICIRSKYVEYITTKLTDTLQADKDYLVEFYISRADRSVTAVKEFGVLFSNKQIMRFDDKGMAIKPPIDFTKALGFRKKTGWIKLSAVYHAYGKEAFISIGYFNYNKPKGYKGFCHYYIDDVTVKLIETKEEAVEPIKEVAETIKEESIAETFSVIPGKTIRLNNIFFVSGKSELLPSSFTELDKLVNYLNDEESAQIKISGHTDNTGSEKQNQSLSEARARSVANYLIEKGIDVGRISSMGYGSSKPVASNAIEEGKQKNRRVEFVISK